MFSATESEREISGQRIFTRELLKTATDTVALARRNIDAETEAAVITKAFCPGQENVS